MNEYQEIPEVFLFLTSNHKDWYFVFKEMGNDVWDLDWWEQRFVKKEIWTTILP